MSKETDIANILANNIDYHPFKSTTGTPLFFDEFTLAKQYASLFGIVKEADLEKFKKAFKIATEGQGGEISKVNSLISSALLPLLVFFRLFGNKENISIRWNLPGIEEEVIFDRCFYEVRNEVIKLPSCADVVLYSSTQNIMLFLESKFTEIYTLETKKKYGKGYIDLYKQEQIKDALTPKLRVTSNKDNLILESDNPCYIEGIKQTISHLIGLVRGPKDYGTKFPEGYSKKYYTSYNEAFNRSRLYYGTILYDLTTLGVDGNSFTDYYELYSDVIGKHGESIIKAIKEWAESKRYTVSSKNDIHIIEHPLTYQQLFQYDNNLELLKDYDIIGKFYNLE